MHEKIGEHPLWNLPVLGPVHADTILTTWVVMIATLVFFYFIGGSYRTNRVNKTQATFEGIINYLADLAVGTLGRAGERFVPIFVSIFIFIWVLNQFGLLPFKQMGLPFGGSPTADLDTTAALALFVFFGIQFVAIRGAGIKAYAHLFQPFWPLFPINLIEEIARPVVLAMRLAFNILAGDLLLFVVATIIAADVTIGPVNLSLVETVVPFGVAVGSAIGDGIVASKAVESIARQPEARGNIFTFFFLGVGILEAFPIIALVLGFYLFFVVANVPSLVGTLLK